MKLSNYTQYFSADKLKLKLTKMRASGKANKALETAVSLWDAWNSPDVGAAKKAAIVGALGYLICPIDVMPDPIYLDDIGIMMGVIRWVTAGVKPKDIELED